MINLGEKEMNAKISKEKIPFLFFTIALILIHIGINISEGSDDIYYISILENFSFSNEGFEQLWQGITLNNRLLINTIMALVLQCNVWVWKIMNISIILILANTILNMCGSAEKITDTYIRVKVYVVMIVGLFLINIRVLSSGAYWIAGSFNYLWGFTACLYAINYYKQLFFNQHNAINRWNKVVIICCTIYATGVEQSAAVFCVFSSIVLITNILEKQKINKFWIINFLVGVIHTLVLVLAPFNERRYMGEVTYWYPNFEMLSVVDKVYQGINHLFNHLFNNTTLLMYGIVILLFMLIKEKYSSYLIRGLASIPVIYISLRIVPINFFDNVIDSGLINMEYNINSVLYNFNNKLFENISQTIQYIPTISAIFILLIIPLLIVLIFREYRMGIYTCLLYLASIAASVILSFSPTIFGSGNRIFFVTDILLLLLLTILSREFIEKNITVSNVMKSSIVIMVSISTINMVETIIHLSKTVYY